jgi:hypothetical protein
MKTKLTENQRRHLGESITIRWGTSRGQDTYGYTTCSLRNQRGKRVAACNGGGYDMRGTVLGNWIARTFANELCALTPAQMDPQSHWQPKHARQCDGKCAEDYRAAFTNAVAGEINTVAGETPEPAPLPDLPDDCFECPVCKGATRASRDGKRIDEGRYFYGLTFHDPDYDPGKAVIGKDCSDRTFSGQSNGKTVEQAEKDGDTVGLERYQAFYSASSKVPTERHRIPLIDGACGVSSVMRILNAIGLSLEKVHDSSKLDIYVIREANGR